MAAVTIRNLKDDLKHRLKLQALSNGRSMEAEARFILETGVHVKTEPKGLGTEIQELFAPLGGIELPAPSREAIRDIEL